LRPLPCEANIASMVRSSLTILLCVSACGEVDRSVMDAGAGSDSGGTPTTYKGTLAQTTPVAFGGMPYCNYTMTLKQLDLQLAILPSKQIVSGHAEALNVEGADTACTQPLIPPSIAKYTFTTAKPSPSGTTLVFTGDTANAPPVTLSVDVVSAGTAFQANLGFHRTDGITASLNWTVIATIPLAP
jgi:hypothetical protein